MDAVTLSTICILCAASPAQGTSSLAQWQPLVAQAAARFSVPGTWINRVLAAESGGRTLLGGQPITSVAGAMGLMQIMPATYADLRQRYRLGSNPYEPHNSIFAGTAYLRELYGRYGYPAMFAAYNAGPHRYEDYLLHGTPLPRATLAYVDAISPGLSRAFASPAASVLPKSRAPRGGLFFALSGAQSSFPLSVEANPPVSVTPALFVPLAR
jgi:soluble lytic murein transglycosylase-like protein